MKSFAVLLLLSSGAFGAERLAVMPVTATDPKLAVTVETALVAAARGVDVVTLVNVEGTKVRGPRVDVKADPRPAARAQALAKEQGATLVAIAEPQALGEGGVVYLQVVDGSGTSRGSTTVVMPATKDGGAIERALRGGLVQLLAPSRFTGMLELRVDVPNARVEIDGHGAALVTALAVGPHAVRVTHPAYHDFLRFVDIEFDRTRTETVALAAFPLAEGEMDDRRKRAGGVTMKMPWYRSWWALGLTGAVLCGATVGIVYGVRAGIHYDNTAHYTGVPTP